jgi:hypothetical protein
MPLSCLLLCFAAFAWLQELKQFIAEGPTFDMSARLESEAAAAISQLSPEQPGGKPQDGSNTLELTLP